MDVEEIAPGLWRWTAPHPDWTPEQGGPDGWESEVGCVYYEAPEAVVLIDPLVPAKDEHRERFWRALERDVEAAGRPVAALVTVQWHERSANEVADRFGKAVWRRGSREALPDGVEAVDVPRVDEVVFWLPEHQAVVAGDVLLGTDGAGVRVCPDSWLPEGAGEEVRASLRSLLDLPVERVLVSHGEPVLSGGRAALAAALG
jgi:glyoxylase-like metal-dependent hydrolase (beta-lactamase superfamily II)